MTQMLLLQEESYPSLLERLPHVLHRLAAFVAQRKGCHSSMLGYGAST